MLKLKSRPCLRKTCVIARFVLSVVPQNLSEWYVLIISFVIGYVFGDIDILLLSWKVLLQKLHLLWNI